MKSFSYYKTVFLIAMAIILVAQPAYAYVQVRISIKFILNASGNRPATGNLNTNAEINGEVDWGQTILAAADNMSELRLFQVELIDLAGVSQWYSSCPTTTNRDNLRNAAIAAPTTYRWRTNAVNIYINGASGCSNGAISDFPPSNNMILMAQNCGNTPSCILHELGHSLDQLHTHEPCCTNQDFCADTITDNQNWSRNQIAQNNFGTTYNNLNATQQDQVDLVFNNVMSYHTSEPQLRFSVCQLDRASGTADDDRTWLLVRQPVYVRYSHTGTQNGRFDTPYKTLQAAEAAGLTNRVVVLHQGNNPITTAVTVDQNSQIVPRLGTATVGNGVALYTIPTDLDQSENPEVRSAIQAVQVEDEAARQVVEEAEQAGALAATEEERTAIKANAELRIKQHRDDAISHLRNAEKSAKGENRVAILLEIAQRYRDSDNCDEASVYFNLVADSTEQVHLREHALYQANHCQELLDMKRYGIGSEWEEITEEEERSE
jgi:hypothetical protein